MFIDIVLPSGNEEEFIEFAKKLGTKGLIFLYDKEDKKILAQNKKLDSKIFPIYSGLIVKNKFNSKYDFLFAEGERKFFENKSINFLFDLEQQGRKDHTHYRQSGLTQVLCVLAKEKNKTICFDFNSLLKGKKREELLGRMMQNARICSKYKANIKIASFATKPFEMRAASDMISLGVVLGLNERQAKDAVNGKV